MLKYMIAGALALAATAAHATVVTPSDLQGWTPANVRTDASVAITGTYKPAGETGSLEFNTNTVTPGQDKADFAHAVNGTLGALINGGALSFDYYVDSASTTASHLAPAFRLTFFDEATNKSGYLIWEDTYNGGGVPTDTWVSNDILAGNFWMRTFGPGFTVEQFGVTLADWANGASFAGSYTLSAATRIVGVEVGVGSGWGNSFKGAVDHVNVSFGTAGQGVNANFEAGVVPEPATWTMMIMGFGAAGALLRRRRLAVAA